MGVTMATSWGLPQLHGVLYEGSQTSLDLVQFQALSEKV